MHKTYIEVNLDNLRHNFLEVKKKIPRHTNIMPVIKANAYGHGVLPVARELIDVGAKKLAIFSVEEAEELRGAGVKTPLLILGSVFPEEAKRAVLTGASIAVFDLSVAKVLSREAKKQCKKVPVHLKVDTGMGRLGVLAEKTLPFVKALKKMPGIEIEGVFSHFSSADDPKSVLTATQLKTFKDLIAKLRKNRITFKEIHIDNSIAAMTLPVSYFDFVRPGIVLYGLSPFSRYFPRGLADIRPVLSFKTKIAQVKTLPKNHCVGYGCTYKTVRKTKVAVIPVGYADGYDRSLSNRAEVLIRGRRAPVIGRISMELTTADVSYLKDVMAGDEVVLIGRQGKEEILTEELAQKINTISYEIVTRLPKSIPRVYIKNGKAIY